MNNFLLLLGIWGVLTVTSFAKAQTHYDTLDETFDLATDNISIQDIERPGWPNGRVCVETAEQNKQSNRMNFVSIGRYTRMMGQFGDLLPQTEMVKILYQPRAGQRQIFSENGDFDSTVTTANDKEITSRTYAPDNTLLTVLNVRKKENWLVFRRLVETESNQRQKYFGYCYYGASPTLLQ